MTRDEVERVLERGLAAWENAMAAYDRTPNGLAKAIHHATEAERARWELTNKEVVSDE